MTENVVILWFRQDLRLSDNQAFSKAATLGTVLPIFIFDDTFTPQTFKIGKKSKEWLHNSLTQLNKSLKGKLNIYCGRSNNVIADLISKYNISSLVYNICYEPWNLEQEKLVQEACLAKNVNTFSFNSNYLSSPTQVLKNDLSYYQRFTPYKNKLYTLPIRDLSKKDTESAFIADNTNNTDIALINKQQEPIEISLKTGEIAAQIKLDDFIKNGISGYKDGRNHPRNKHNTSALSPHLHYGEISPVQVWRSIVALKNIPDEDKEHFLSEIVWREFSCYLMWHFKNLHTDNFQPRFNQFPWDFEQKLFTAWKTGNTGYPFVDAGMRELQQTGSMHNRLRMITASFLVKNLNIHWHMGRDWFWEHLFDADLANNSASWQWVSGCGVDAAPYFRIFNPVTQGEKFDPDGNYTKKFIPELQNLPKQYLFQPWSAPLQILRASGVTLGENYPKPIVDLSTSRKAALQRLKEL